MQDNTPISFWQLVTLCILSYFLGHFQIFSFIGRLKVTVDPPAQQTAPAKPNCTPNGRGGYTCAPNVEMLPAK